jgi:hypothetical protein
MKKIIFLYDGKIKRSIFDKGIIELQKELFFKAIFYISQRKHKFSNEIVYIRSSQINTLSFELNNFVYPSYKDRVRSRNKYLLFLYCKKKGILAPQTYTQKFFNKNFIIKSESGSDCSLIESNKNIFVVQKRISGEVVKLYGSIFSNKFIGYGEKNKNKIKIPQKIILDSQKILKDHNLIFGGLDWIKHGGEWYLIDINATAGCNFISVKEVKDIIRPVIAHLLL